MSSKLSISKVSYGCGTAYADGVAVVLTGMIEQRLCRRPRRAGNDYDLGFSGGGLVWAIMPELNPVLTWIGRLFLTNDYRALRFNY